MRLRSIQILENDTNKKGDLFGRLMGDLFHALGYDKPKLNIHKSGRELDIVADHRTEKKRTIAECKAHSEKIGGSDVNKFIGVLDAEKRRAKKGKKFKEEQIIGYFISLSGFRETAIEQEEDIDNERIILLNPVQIVEQLIKGRIIVSIPQAVSIIPNQSTRKIMDYVDLLAYEGGWVWVIYYSETEGQTPTHFSLVHAEGKLLVSELVEKIIDIDKGETDLFLGLNRILPPKDESPNIEEARYKYFRYIENECGEIQFEGLPTDKDAGSVKVKLENIFVPLFLTPIESSPISASSLKRINIGQILEKERKLAILAKPGGGKSTLIKRIAIAYAFSERRKQINDDLPDLEWFPIFIRCRELGEKINLSITEIISSIPQRAEIVSCLDGFNLLTSDALQKGNALLLIDGLDEITEDRNRITFVNQLRTFIATYPNINVIVTSREAGFRVVGGYLADYCTHYKISNLIEEEIENLTIKWHCAILDDTESTKKEAKTVADLIIKETRIKILAENPLLLTTLLFVKRWAGYLPTKKHVLYQEMIKLLLVTWNVEGHEQLDIDETEPQLAFIAFWMTSNGQQTITESDLKNCLLQARKQMPDVLEYTKISVSDFIKRVESRSSLLIMAGHERTREGNLTPIYEFLHLSFQEYLVAKAIVERYVPEKFSNKSSLDILKPHIKKENWKEVIPLVAILAKRGNKDLKELIDHLIKNAKAEASDHLKETRIGIIGTKKIVKGRSSSAGELLGSCISNEIQINPAQLEIAIEWYAKNRTFRYGNITETILNSKFSDIFQKIVSRLFFDHLDESFVSILGSLIVEIDEYLSIDDPDLVHFINKNIYSTLKQERCRAILALMNIAFKLCRERTANIVTNLLDFDNIFSDFLSVLEINDEHYNFSIYWCVAWAIDANIFPKALKYDFVNVLIKRWIPNQESDTQRMLCWALSRLLEPRMTSVPMFTKEILEKSISTPKYDFEQLVAVYLSILNQIDFNLVEVKNILSRHNQRGRKVYSVELFAKQLGIELESKEI